MPYNVTLSQLVDQLRAEIGASTNSGQGINALPMMQQILRRTQERLYIEFAWPHLCSTRDEDLLQGERYYTFNSDVNFDRIEKAEILYANQWLPTRYGINALEYNTMQSDNDVRSAPVTNWQHYERNQYEVWPIPSASTQTIRFYCGLTLRPLIANDDPCDLDSTLLVLFAAAEILTKLKSAEAQTKQTLATAHYKNLRGNQIKEKVFIMGGIDPSIRQPLTDDWTLRAPIIA